MRKSDPAGPKAGAAGERICDTDPARDADPSPDANTLWIGLCVADTGQQPRYPDAAAPDAEVGALAQSASPAGGGPGEPALITPASQRQNDQNAQDIGTQLSGDAAPPPGQAVARDIALTSGRAAQVAPNDLLQIMPHATEPPTDSPPANGEVRGALPDGAGRLDQTGKPAPALAQGVPTGAVETSQTGGKETAQSPSNSGGPADQPSSDGRRFAFPDRGVPTAASRSIDTRGDAPDPAPAKVANLPKGSPEQDGPGSYGGVEPALHDAVKPDSGTPAGAVILPAALAHMTHGRGRGNSTSDLADPIATGVVGAPPPAEPDRKTAMANAHRPLPQTVAHQLALNISHQPAREVEITLSPDELGKVRMTVSAIDGALTLTLTADRGDTLDLLRRHIDQLAQDFRDLGFDRLNFSFSQGGGDKAPDAKDWPTGGGADPPDALAPEQKPDHQMAALSGGLDLRL